MIVQVTTPKLLKEFINLQYSLYQNDPYFVPPLFQERKEFLDPKKNPFFNYAEVALFIAYQDGKAVGRISAQVNRLHNERYNEKTGHFGLFECINDKEVAKSLFEAARNYLKDHGMNQMTGPFSLSINEETGMLLEGFDSSPYPFMGHNPSYHKELYESFGFAKIKDTIAWSYDATRPVPEPAMQIADVVRQYPGLVIREVNLSKMDKEIEIISDVFNSAWSKNWGFVPWTREELKKSAKDLKMILDPRFALIAEVNGVPAAISIAIPNYHEAIKDLNGKLFPFGLFKFLYRLKIKGCSSARLALLGIKKEFRSDILGGLSVLLYTEMHRRGQKHNVLKGELSWTLEDNDKINNGISLMGGVPYKKYRVFQYPIQ